MGLVVAAVLAEISLRVFCRSSLNFVEDERSLAYRYDAELGWFPKSNSETVISASRSIIAKHNSDGFRDREFVASTNPAILFLGDSFVWGYDVEAPERFTDKLQAKHPEWTIYNCGVSGYGTDQEYLLLQKTFDRFKPRVVFLMYCSRNDYMENGRSFVYGYYKPYFTAAADGSRLAVQGVPVPRGERFFWSEHKYFRRLYLARVFIKVYYKVVGPTPVQLNVINGFNQNPTVLLLLAMNEYVRSKGAMFVIGVTDTNPNVEAFLKANNITYVDVTTRSLYPTFGEHWTPEGHTAVCDKVEQKLLPLLSGRGSDFQQTNSEKSAAY